MMFSLKVNVLSKLKPVAWESAGEREGWEWPSAVTDIKGLRWESGLWQIPGCVRGGTSRHGHLPSQTTSDLRGSSAGLRSLGELWVSRLLTIYQVFEYKFKHWGDTLTLFNRHDQNSPYVR